MRLLDILIGMLVLFPLLADAVWFEIPGLHSLELSDLGLPLLVVALVAAALRRRSRLLWSAAGVLGALFLSVLLSSHWALESQGFDLFTSATWKLTHGTGAVAVVALVAAAGDPARGAGFRARRGRPRAFLPRARALQAQPLGERRSALALLALSSAEKRERLRFSSGSFHVAAVLVGVCGLRLRTALGESARRARPDRGARRQGIGCHRRGRSWHCLGGDERQFLAQPLAGRCARGGRRGAVFFRRQARAANLRRRLRIPRALRALRRRSQRRDARAFYAAQLFLVAAHRSRAPEFSFLDARAARLPAAFCLARGAGGAAALPDAVSQRRRPARSHRVPLRNRAGRGAFLGASSGACGVCAALRLEARGSLDAFLGRGRFRRERAHPPVGVRKTACRGGAAVLEPGGSDGRLGCAGPASRHARLDQLSRTPRAAARGRTGRLRGDRSQRGHELAAWQDRGGARAGKIGRAHV